MELLINKIKSYVPLSAEDEIVIRTLFHKKELKKGEHLLEAGNVCRHIIFIETGLVRYYINNDGVEQTTYFNKENEFVCDNMSFLTQIPSHVNIQALEDSTVWMISYTGIQQFYKEVTTGERFGRLAIEEVFVSAATRSFLYIPTRLMSGIISSSVIMLMSRSVSPNIILPLMSVSNRLH